MLNSTKKKNSVSPPSQISVPPLLHLSASWWDENVASTRCQPGTRSSLLREIRSWVQRLTDERPVCWLAGPPSIGKSTIARTVYSRYNHDRAYAAAIFFHHSDPLRNTIANLIPSLSYQFAEQKEIGDLRIIIDRALLYDKLLLDGRRSMQYQFQKLIVDPIIEARYGPNLARIGRERHFVIVIDGVDECVDQEKMREFMKMLITDDVVESYAEHLRILVTSRVSAQEYLQTDSPSPPMVRTISLSEDVSLRSDIEKLLKGGLSNPKKKLKIFATSWPSSSEMSKLVDLAMSDPVPFVHASALIHFINEGSTSSRSKNLALALSGDEGIHAVYLTIRPSEYDLSKSSISTERTGQRVISETSELTSDQIVTALKDMLKTLENRRINGVDSRMLEGNMCNVLAAVVRNKSNRTVLINLQGEDAHFVLDSFQWLLDYGQFPDHKLRLEIWRTLQSLAGTCGLYPERLIIQDVLSMSSEAITAGSYGEIYQGKFRGQLVCLKLVKLYQTSDIERCLKAFSREAVLWSQLKHRNLLPFYGIHYFGGLQRRRISFVSPWMINGNIKDYLSKEVRVNRLLLVCDIAHGIRYLHHQSIVHGDLKAANILVSPSGRACLADFGMSSLLFTQWSTTETSGNPRGTLRFLAPELLRESDDGSFRPSKMSDVYAFACVCYEIYTMLVPYHDIGDGAVVLRLQSPCTPPRPPLNSLIYKDWGLTQTIWELMEECWQWNPTDRPTMDDVCSRKLFKGFIVTAAMQSVEAENSVEAHDEEFIGEADTRPEDEWEQLISVPILNLEEQGF